MKKPPVILALALLLPACGGGGGGGGTSGPPPVVSPWSQFQELAPLVPPADAADPRVAVTPGGMVITLWRQSGATGYDVWARRFVTGTGWTAAELVETDDTGSVDVPEFAVDANGNAMAVWPHSDGSRFNIRSSRFDGITQTWGAPGLVEFNDVGDSKDVRVAMDNAGNSIAIWKQWDGTRFNIFANRHTAGFWGIPTLIETTDFGNAERPRIAVNPVTGDAFAQWRQFTGPRASCWTNRFTVAGGWATATLMEMDDTGDVSQSDVACDTTGKAWAIWTQDIAGTQSLFASRWSGASWSTAVEIEATFDGPSRPKVVCNGDDLAVAAFQQFDGTLMNLWTNTCTAGTWSGATLLENDDVAASTYIDIASDGAGKMIAVWARDLSGDEIVSRRFTGGSWGPVEIVQAGPSLAYNSRVALNAAGLAACVWTRAEVTQFVLHGALYQP